MKKLALFSSLSLVCLVGAVQPSAAAPVVAAPPKAEVVPKPNIKRISKLTTKPAAAVVGETRTVEATLLSGEAPLAGKEVRFKFEGGGFAIVIGTGTTNAQGKATASFKIPEVPAAAYNLKASFAGDDEVMASADDANFGIIKGLTKFDVSYNWGALDSHGGPQYGTLLVSLRRQSDNAALNNKTIHFTVNGASRDYTITNGISVTILLPTNTNTWNTKLAFDGDASQQAVQVDKTYSH